MRTFTFFVYDDRYSVPTLDFAVAGDAERARALAIQTLLASVHHRHVEVSDDGGLLFDLARNGIGDGRAAL